MFDEIIQIEEQINGLFEKKQKLISEFIAKNNTGIESRQNADGTWTRITVTDNATKLNDGFFKVVKVERFSLKVDVLKNKPKELA